MIVHPGIALAQQPVFRARLELEACRFGNRHLGGGFRQRTIAGALAAGLVHHHGILGAAFGGRHIPLFGGSGDQHRSGARTRLAQLVPAARDGGRTAGALVAIDFGIHPRLFHHNGLPVGIQLFGHDQAESGLDPLADFRPLGIDRHDIVRGDANKGVDDLRRIGGHRRTARQVEGQHQAGTARDGEFHKAAAAHFGESGGGQRFRVADQRGDIGIGLGELGHGLNRHGFLHWRPS